VLFFSVDGAVPDAYRRHLPPGWTFTTLRSRTDEQDVLRQLADVDVLVHADVPITRSHLAAAGRLGLVQRQGVGVDAVDRAALREHGVALAVCPHGSAEAVAEHALLLTLAAGRHLVQLHEDVVRLGTWPKWEYRQRSLGLHGAVFGVVGFGRIGQATARLALAFGSSVLVHRRRPGALGEPWAHQPVELADDLDDLFSRADVVSLHCPLLEANRGMVDARRLALMRPGSVLVNTARGALVVEDDLVDALRAGRPAAAGLDVLVDEPPSPDNPLLSLPNVVLTPHCAAGNRDTVVRKVEAVIANIDRWWTGQPLEDQVL